MRTILLKKSELAQLKGLGKTTEEMATKYGITTKEMLNTLIGFGLSKARLKTKEVEYTINVINDIDTEEVTNTPNYRLEEVNA
jgi:hypothetical protein